MKKLIDTLKLLKFMLSSDEIWEAVYRTIVSLNAVDHEIRVEFDNDSFLVNYGDRIILGNPLVHTGTALRLAKNFNIKLSAGTSFGDCRADINKEDFLCSINPHVDQFSYGVWHKKPVEEIDSIYAYGTTVNEAVVKCLVFARRAGVI